MINIFTMNDIDIKSFLRVVAGIQISMLALIYLDINGVHIPLLREFIGFLYLTYLPGVIILRILNLHELGNIKTVLYSFGLSIATLMFLGFFMNAFFPLFGILKPISLPYLLITISLFVLVSCLLSYIKDKDFSNPHFVNIQHIMSQKAIFLLCSVPFLAILGTYVMNFYNENLFSLIFIGSVIIILFLAISGKMPNELHPFAIFIVSISLLYHTTLISNYIWGWDVHYEYYLANLVIKDSFWNPKIAHTYNAMLSIVMLSPIYSEIMGINLIWVFKIIYPFLFSLVPVGLYLVFYKFLRESKIAFLSTFFFVSIFTFYMELPYLCRQQIAELFFVLIMLLMIDDTLKKRKRTILFIIFAFSLALSHYSLSYLFIIFSSCVFFVSFLLNKFSNKKFELKTITSSFILLFLVFSLTWYMYISSSYTFDIIIQIGNHIINSIFTDFLNPEKVEGLRLALSEGRPTLLSIVHRALNYANQFFIILGFATVILYKKLKVDEEYILFSGLSLLLLIVGISVPFFASSISMSRLYHITLFFLAPFCIVGGYVLIRKFLTNKKSTIKVLAVYFAIFFCFKVVLPMNCLKVNHTQLH